jgi:hypothetical protein
MKSKVIVAMASAVLGLAPASPAAADPPALSITIPLYFGGHRAPAAQPAATAADIRAERRLRYARYGMQLADAIVSAIGYHAYARCLSCLAYPGGGPFGSRPVTVADFNANRPAESDPLIQPFSRGGFLSLSLGTLAYDLIDARVEKHWPVERRASADLAEIGAHAWGISTWVPEITAIGHESAVAAACGAQWQAKRFGEAFTDGCVNAYYRAGTAAPGTTLGRGIIIVCAPSRFKRGTYLFAAGGDAIVASGSACADGGSALP